MMKYFDLQSKRRRVPWNFFATGRVYPSTMRKLVLSALVLAAFAPPLAAQTTGQTAAAKPTPQAASAKPAAPAPAGAGSFTGKWEGAFMMQGPDGTDGPPKNVVFNLTQAGKALTGTAGPPEEQWPIANGAVTTGKATFEVQQPNGPLFKFTLTIVKGRLAGEMTGEKDGVVRGKAKVDAGKAVVKK